MKTGQPLLLMVIMCFLTPVLAADGLWISFDGSSTQKVVLEMKRAGVSFKLNQFQPGDTVAVAQIQKDDLPLLTRVFHDDFNRCGGYRVHTSATDAHLAKAQVALSKTASKMQMVDYSLDNAEVVAQLLEPIDAVEIADTIVHLSDFDNRFYDTQSGVDAAHWLREHWDNLAQNIKGASSELYAHSGFIQPSVILTIPGSEFPDEVVVLGGHLDSTVNGGSSDSPGADDDASGVACVTEVLRVLAQTGFQPKRTLKFMGYAGEEHGLLGSDHIARDFAAANVNVVGVLQLDMTNYQGSSEDIWFISDFTNAPQTAFMAQLVDVYMPGTSRSSTACGYACSDHASWTFAGYPASFPFEARFGEYNPTIHSSGDTLAVSGGDAVHAAKFARLAVCYVAELAKGSIGAAAPTSFNTRVDIATMLQLFAGRGPCTETDCPRDLDLDGDVDLDDMLLLNENWNSNTCLGFTQGDGCN